MKKKIKKKIKRKNPKLDEIALTNLEISFFKRQLENATIYGEFKYLVNAIKISKIGYKCTDCDNNYEQCKCEWCEDCKNNECVCHYINGFSSRDEIREIAWNFSKKMFNIRNLIDFKNGILYNLQFEGKEYTRKFENLMSINNYG